MKNNPVLIAFLCVLVALIAANCKKSTYNNPNSISATIGTSSWQSQAVTGLKVPGIDVISLVGIYGKAGDTTTIEIDIVDSIHVNVPDPFFNADVRYNLYNGTNYDAQPSYGSHGTLTVTSWDTAGHRIAGTFNGIFYNVGNNQDSVAITNGLFNTSYTVF